MEIQEKDLNPHWVIAGMAMVSLLAYIVICHQFGHELIAPLPEEKRILFRSVFYVIAIVTMPITNLIRHIQIRLNQTMPGNRTAKIRYLQTIIVSMILVDTIGILGLVMFMLGDDFNTLYMFTGLSALGLYLYRPKEAEYVSIVEALADRD